MKRIVILLLVTAQSVFAQDYEILFTKQVNNNDNIHSINQDGRLKQITNHPRKDSSPVMSPDGEYMVFTSERKGWWKIWLMNLESGEFKQLTDASSAEYSPSWSPDGNQIVFVSSRNGGSEIYTMTRNGNAIKQISTGRNNTMPSWASNGRIYYSSQVNGVYQIMSAKPDGSDTQQLTTGKGDKLMPQLSPDQRMMLYYGNLHGNMEIYKMELASGQAIRLTNNPLMDIRARWSPDGSLIVFERGNKRNNQQIYLMRADGSEQKPLTRSGYNYAPSFAVKVD
ncbi:TolB family protein [Reichenbachiella sp.]|uniref:TolB family protein n=1 Tax=Reichenbachiella sp. TaxID=2184521 RepID=UPI003BAE2310